MESGTPDPQANGSVPLKLAVRLLDSHYPYMDSDERPRLFDRGLPEDSPFDVPIPDGLTLVGSATLAPQGRRMLEVVLDTGMSAARVRDAYRDTLPADGWEEDHRTRDGGFASGPRGVLISFARNLRRSARGAPVDLPGLSAVFRRDGRRQTLVVSAEERRGGPTDVRLRLISGRNPSPSHRNDPEALFVMPLLTPPPQSRTSDENTGLLAPPRGSERSGGEYGGNSWEHDGAYSFAALESDLDLASITAHYARQLEFAGWSKTGGGQDGPQAWISYTFWDNEGHSWEAAFTVLHLPATPGRYLLNLRADRTPKAK